jgi:hypothetical protein
MGWRRQRDRSGHAGLFAGVAFKVTSRPVIGCYRPPGLKTESAGSFTARFLPAKFRGVHSRRFPKGEIRAQWQGNVELSIETARRGHFCFTQLAVVDTWTIPNGYGIGNTYY